MEKIRELLSRLTSLTADELDELRGLIVEEDIKLDSEPENAETGALYSELAEAGDQVMAEGESRAVALQEAQQAKVSARERIAKLNGEVEEEETPSETPAAEEEETEEETPADPAAEETPAEVPVAVTATGAVARMARNQGKPQASPEALQPKRTVLTASAGHQAGRPLADKLDLAKEMSNQLKRMDRNGPNGGKVIVASAEFEYPEDRKLGPDAWENERKILDVVGPEAPRYDKRTKSLVATGGICAPVNVDYTVGFWATAERPLRDGLATFDASRGGIKFVSPPDIAEWEGATGIWTEATDASPGSATKPVVSMTCGSEQLVYVEAVSTRIGFGNMQSRFAPEQVAANTDAAMAAAARVADNNLLNLIAEKCVENVTFSEKLGATRDLLTLLFATVEMYRSVHRLPDTQALTGIFPRWLKGLIKQDIARESSHSQNNYYDALRIPDSYVEDMIADTGINPIWHLDGQTTSVSGGVAQYFLTDTKAAEYKKFPTKMVWYFFAEDMIQFLDGGRLDLGVVRDSTLDATNDYETFVETFEGIAFRGFTNGALQLVTELCASGGTSGTVTAACP